MSATLHDVLNPSHTDRLAALGACTAGAADHATCLAAGLSDRQLHQLVHTGRWQSPFPRVYITFSGPLPVVTMQYAALAYAGDGAMLSHESAGHLWRLCRQPPAIHLTVPYRRSVSG